MRLYELLLASLIAGAGLFALLPLGTKTRECACGLEFEGAGYEDADGNVWCERACFEEASEQWWTNREGRA